MKYNWHTRLPVHPCYSRLTGQTWLRIYLLISTTLRSTVIVTIHNHHCTKVLCGVWNRALASRPLANPKSKVSKLEWLHQTNSQKRRILSMMMKNRNSSSFGRFLIHHRGNYTILTREPKYIGTCWINQNNPRQSSLPECLYQGIIVSYSHSCSSLPLFHVQIVWPSSALDDT